MSGAIIIGLIVLVIVIIVCCAIAKSGNNFRDNSQQIHEGMTYDEVIQIMGEPSFRKKHQDGSFELVYEKSEWKGFVRGGTATRRMEIVVSSKNIVISVGKNNNCDRTGW